MKRRKPKPFPWKIIDEIDDSRAAKTLWLVKPTGRSKEGDEFIVAFGLTGDDSSFPKLIEGGANEFRRLVELHPQLNTNSTEMSDGGVLWAWLSTGQWRYELSGQNEYYLSGEELDLLERLADFGLEAVRRAEVLWDYGNLSEELTARNQDVANTITGLQESIEQAIKEFSPKK